MFNLVIILGLTFFIALILVYFISSHDRRFKEKQTIAIGNNGQKFKPIDFRQFSKMCVDLCEILKLDVTDVSKDGTNQVVIHAQSENPITQVEYLIVGFHLRATDQLDRQRIVEISDTVISERLSKAIVITTAQIDHSIRNLPELAPMEFIDGAKFGQLVAEHKINH